MGKAGAGIFAVTIGVETSLRNVFTVNYHQLFTPITNHFGEFVSAACSTTS
ncbi:hypothetical protein [Peribacillus simplex]|uniref:hypothetical protein n=1 Tax=Peribacillus simplex TaxID=1478 RepID=UPI001629C61F|nr:hypothetical protein [Peribacillus simplex]